MNHTLKADTGHFVLSPSATTTSDSVTTAITRASGTVTSLPSGGALSNKDIENAVYGHIRAIRALKRTTVDSHEIARALGLPPAAVAQAMQSLANKGVKIVG